jgi:hypothetical protein
MVANSKFYGTLDELVIELAEDGSGYRCLGSPADADRRSRLEIIRDLLPSESPGKTAQELRDDWPSDPKPSARTVAQDLIQRAEAENWSKERAGKSGDPYRFWCNGNSICAAIDPRAARNESDAQSQARVDDLWEKGGTWGT